MAYRIEISDEADAELNAAYLFLSQRSPEAAFRWFKGAKKIINSLSLFPRRCPIARENAGYSNHEVRQLIYGAGLSAYRVLFIIFEEDQEIRVMQFRRGARHTGSPETEDK